MASDETKGQQPNRQIEMDMPLIDETTNKLTNKVNYNNDGKEKNTKLKFHRD